ncbi:putative glutathione synthetase [Trypanosoma cruzi]|uniref:Glutathione synthetase n=2 Tax=Trypanosoma cruzi TaxID=5693 RepID=Q4D526_TRYCC|nr:glutathione synthetase, putative [Trypanosoma cruzi]EAN87628.1 glutathione synthetase, putative [Trypanosoma cruzi]PWV07444.1 putative glutathione synthetase [Trypanosoma cruzi]|eukprot:XP_809479.1 glutathione synthetase [Trypanosoma cruzi strain CL Brener]
MELLGDAEQLVAKCMMLGLTIQMAGHEDATTHLAVTLQPTTMRRGEFDVLCRRQLLWNEAVNNTARNFQFLLDALRETAASDTEFTGKLVKILRDVYLGTSPYQPLMLGIFRTDYMRDGAAAAAASTVAETMEEDAAAWKNVEINTISSSFAGLSPLVSDFHRQIAMYQRALGGGSAKNTADGHENNDARPNLDNAGVLERSTAAKIVPEALAAAVAAWSSQQDFEAFRDAYGKEQQHCRLLEPIVLFIIQENERNTADQFALIFELLESHGIPSLRRTLRELQVSMKLHPVPNGPPLAIVDERYPVAVAYFRSTYVPADFPTKASWDTRLAVEQSSAIKCPSIPYHLLTFKKFQQLFCDVGNVLTPIAFCGDAVRALQLQTHFVPQYSLNPAEVGEDAVQRVIDDALQHPARYVLKPQLEGGGNLIAGQAMQEVLRKKELTDPLLYNRVRREYILMSRIEFPVRSGAFLVNGKVVQLEKNICSELGIYGVILSDAGGCLLQNACAGYVVRSKPADVDDGGVMAGVAALDSLALV